MQSENDFRVTLVRAGGGLPEGGRALIVPEGVRVTSDAGLTHDMPFAAMRVESAGLDAEFVSCRDAVLSISSDAPAFLEALTRMSGGTLAQELEALARHRGKQKSRRWLGIGAVLATLACILGCIFSTPRLIAASVRYMPTSVDRTIGDAADGEVASFGPRYHDPETNALVTTIVDRLTAHAGEPRFDYRVSVVESDQINAFALPGGRIVVLTGLIAFAETPDEIAGVIGHEIAHVTGRHGLRNVAHRLGTTLVLMLLFGDASELAQAGGAAAAMAMDSGYSREQEAAADLEGQRIAHAAGFDARALASFFERMQARASSLERAMAWRGDHPDNAARIRAIRASAPAERRGADEALVTRHATVRAKLPAPE